MTTAATPTDFKADLFFDCPGNYAIGGSPWPQNWQFWGGLTHLLSVALMIAETGAYRKAFADHLLAFQEAIQSV